ECLWNDVIHFSPVHPGKIKQLCDDEQLNWHEHDWFEIDAEQIGFSSGNSLIFMHYFAGRDIVTIAPQELEPYCLQRVAELAEIPERTRRCYREARLGTAKHFLFAGIPHVLYKGSLNVEGAAVIRV